MSSLLFAAAAFASGLLGAMGLGGGAVLIVFLTLFAKSGQLAAQGANLILFIPVSLTATVINTLRRRIDFCTVLPLGIGGAAGAAAGFFIAENVNTRTLSVAFGAFIAFIGVKEIVKGVKTMLATRRGR